MAATRFATYVSRSVLLVGSALRKGPESLHGTSLALLECMLRASLSSFVLSSFALTAFLCLATGCPEQLPAEDLCSSTSQAQLTRIEVGDSYEGFMPLGPESYTEVQYGPQGGSMVFFKVRAFGVQVPQCMTVQVALTDASGEMMGRAEVSVNFYEDEDGLSKTSRPLQVTLFQSGPYEGKTATLQTQIGSAIEDAEVTLHDPS